MRKSMSGGFWTVSTGCRHWTAVDLTVSAASSTLSDSPVHQFLSGAAQYTDASAPGLAVLSASVADADALSVQSVLGLQPVVL